MKMCMLYLTPQLLDSYPYSQHADPKTIQRGRAYYKEGRVWDVTLALEVSERLKGGDDFDEDDKPEAFLPTRPRQQPRMNWQNKLSETLALIPHHAPASNYSRYVALAMMTRPQYGYYGYGSAFYATYSLEPFIIRANEWDFIGGGALNSPQEIDDFLNTNKKWIKAGTKLTHSVSPAGCLNL